MCATESATLPTAASTSDVSDAEAVKRGMSSRESAATSWRSNGHKDWVYDEAR
ncbi:MAG: hypothetical protein R2873_18325 [Caldilineaceae bacterium]